ncbi:sigma-70 family RNA polymerase sigma factor [Sphingobacterium phlebotomi]|uniref:Sigma-70 family RNA polymerase sigma factor n=1 Tax=Sphingobacterium phlebotomi TaxID=2605433 RepID=A0A5D4HCS7_9SPHI|nr:sigma-70 family RNA polymerase sigma factor [Sphingobacterium phlebotomi]TYR38374.1 sigma-70 family RNA polymerase sigma factor [Sphingobacterium phlebotomi]
MTNHSHIAYWQCFIRGDEDAFKALYDVYVNALFAYGIRYCSDEEIVKDSIHDLFVDLHRYRSRLSPNVNVKAYLFGSLRRKVVESKKRNISRSIYAENYRFRLELETEDYITLSDDKEDEVLTKLRAEMEKLPHRQKEALYLRFTCEMSYEQVAQIMDISIASCRTFIYRAVKDLRQRMENNKISQLLFIAFLPVDAEKSNI